jgi:hypothetical protein
MIRRLSPIATGIAAALWLAAPAAADCSRSFDVSGPTEGLRCTYNGDPESNDDATPSWSVPAGATRARFDVWGGNAPTGPRGGYVRATLPVSAGETYALVLGFEGWASSVSRDGTRLLVGGGGDGREANYVAPGAQDVYTEAPGTANPPGFNGTIFISWIQPEPCVVPRLRGKRPVAARRALRAARCRGGEVVRRPAGAAMRNRVIGQSRRTGKVLPRGTVVHLTAGRLP